VPCLFAQAQRESRTQHTPVFGVEVGIAKLLRWQGLNREVIEPGVLLEPAPHHPQIGGRELPLDFACLSSGSIGAAWLGRGICAGAVRSSGMAARKVVANAAPVAAAMRWGEGSVSGRRWGPG